MAGYIRRYGYFPGVETLNLIEGVVIVDLPPPASIKGVGTGMVACIGEFADFSNSVSVSATGLVSSNHTAVQVRSAQDLLDNFGGWDATLGEMAISGGNGFATLRNKTFAELVVVAINLGSTYACRMTRSLPWCKTATDPSPIVPLQAGLVAAGRPFINGANEINSGKRVVFSDDAELISGVDGVLSIGAATFDAAGSDFVAAGVEIGDILVTSITTLPADSGTYRVLTVAGPTQLTLQEMDGTAFVAAGNDVALPFRVHPAATADSAGVDGNKGIITAAAGYTIPVRPTNQTVAAGTLLAPVVVPDAASATVWDPVSDLQLVAHPTQNIVYVAGTQAPNAASVAALDALYTLGIDALLAESDPASSVDILIAARTSNSIRLALRTHCLEASAKGNGRICVISPPLSTVLVSGAIAAATPGVGAYRNERVLYSWPGERTFIPEAVSTTGVAVVGGTTTDGILDVRADARLASLLSNLPPERNPGQAAAPVPAVMSSVVGLQRTAPQLTMNDYIALKGAGICALRIDRTSGTIFQSGKTTSLTSGQENINRRRMADFIEDSLANALVSLSKLPLTQALKDSILSEIVAFMEQLLSINNPAAQRINGYLVDDVSGNTPALEAAGIHVVITKVRSLATADTIVVQAEVGESVNVTAS